MVPLKVFEAQCNNDVMLCWAEAPTFAKINCQSLNTFAEPRSPGRLVVEDELHQEADQEGLQQLSGPRYIELVLKMPKPAKTNCLRQPIAIK